MGKDYIHTAEAKFKQGLLDRSEIPDSLQKKWDRWNFDIAEETVRENWIKDKDCKKQLEQDLEDIKQNGLY